MEAWQITPTCQRSDTRGLAYVDEINTFAEVCTERLPRLIESGLIEQAAGIVFDVATRHVMLRAIHRWLKKPSGAEGAGTDDEPT